MKSRFPLNGNKCGIYINHYGGPAYRQSVNDAMLKV